MTTARLRWSTDTILACGSNRIGSVYHSTSNRNTGPWFAVCTLPGAGIPEIYKAHSTPEAARLIVQTAALKWFEACGIKARME